MSGREDRKWQATEGEMTGFAPHSDWPTIEECKQFNCRAEAWLRKRGELGKWKMDAAGKTELRAGATWRSGTDVDALLGEFEDLPNRPQVLSLGLAVKRPFDLGAGWGVSATGSVPGPSPSFDRVRESADVPGEL